MACLAGSEQLSVPPLTEAFRAAAGARAVRAGHAGQPALRQIDSAAAT